MKTFEDFLKSKGVESVEGKKADELAALYNEYNAEIRKELQKAIDENREDVKKLRAQFDDVRDEQIKQLNEALKAQGLAIAKMQNQAEPGKEKTFSQQLRENLKANAAKLKVLKEGQKSDAKTAEFDFEIKTAGTMTSSNISGGNVPVEDRIEGFNTVASRSVRLLDLVSTRSTMSNVVSWVYQANKDGTAGQTAEGSAKNQIDFDLVVASQSLKKTTAFIKVSTEMLDDIDWLQSEIQGELLRELLKAVETQTYSGDNTGQNHNGILTTATAFSAGTFANTVDNANTVDVLEVAINQIKIANQDPPTAILMYPSDVTALKLVKVTSTDKRYVERLALIGDRLSISGVPIIETTLVTAGDYLVGDFSKALSVSKGGIRIDIGLDSDDFTKNLRTILAEWRGLTIVKNNDRTAFVTGDFATDAAALETP